MAYSSPREEEAVALSRQLILHHWVLVNSDSLIGDVAVTWLSVRLVYRYIHQDLNPGDTSLTRLSIGFSRAAR
ncbi:hypothetical protein E2C01_011615 [Portunus trituberculatus]|uniref:Uncharacterized protein n=1 Tax=Portunus trituberculatus TaxID=210409 RepID=A0A5B7DBL5_PORTR|nr:hypothetical protein [Portunus trituberculatus]